MFLSIKRWSGKLLLMKKAIFYILGVFTFVECSALEPLQWNETLLPDFRLVIAPVMFNDFSGVSALFEAGRQNYRCNGTIGYAFDDCLAKISAEYLTQKLGFSFCSVHEHHWVRQGAIGAALQFPFNAECGFSYSHADKKKLMESVVPLQNKICMKKIAGSNGFRLFCGSSFSFWDSSEFNGKIVYDYVKFDRSFQKDKVVSGFGLNLAFDQNLSQCTKIHLGVAVEAPFIAYDASISTHIHAFRRTISVGVYGQRVHGLKSIPSSSRIGIEIELDLENIWCGASGPACSDSFSSWLSRPAVYMPQVLVVKDHNAREFGSAPIGNLPSSVTFSSEVVDFDVSDYFIGTTPLIYEAIWLPVDLTLNPISGKIAGVIAPGSYHVIIKATNYFGTHSQLVTFNYQG